MFRKFPTSGRKGNVLLKHGHNLRHVVHELGYNTLVRRTQPDCKTDSIYEAHIHNSSYVQALS